jgi:hypothetical protein
MDIIAILAAIARPIWQSRMATTIEHSLITTPVDHAAFLCFLIIGIKNLGAASPSVQIYQRINESGRA